MICDQSQFPQLNVRFSAAIGKQSVPVLIQIKPPVPLKPTNARRMHNGACSVTYMAWQDDLNTGIAVIDNQHKRIVEMINHLHDVMHRRDQREISVILDELVDYTLSHFTFEESLMEDAGYEFSRAHKRVHEIFIKRVSEYRLRFRSGEDISEELLHTLSHWLFNHIRSDDKAIVDSIRHHMRDARKASHGSRSLSQTLTTFFRRAK